MAGSGTLPTAHEAAQRLGVSRQRINQVCKALGITLPHGQALGYRLPPVKTQIRKNPPLSRVVTGGVPVPLSRTVAGTIGELLVAADLMARRFWVFFPLVRSTACDLIGMDRAGRTEKIEVRCGKRVDGRIVYARADEDRSDRRAIVVTGEPVIYAPPFPGEG